MMSKSVLSHGAPVEDILKMFSARLVLLCLILVSANFVYAVIPLHIFTYLASASYAAHLLLNLSNRRAIHNERDQSKSNGCISKGIKNGSRKFTNNISRKVDLKKKKDSKTKVSYHHHF